jgi:hypothetical protein
MSLCGVGGLDDNRIPQFVNVRQPLAQLASVLIDDVKLSVVIRFFVKLLFYFQMHKHAMQRIQRQRSEIGHSRFSSFRECHPLSRLSRGDSRRSAQGRKGLLFHSFAWLAVNIDAGIHPASGSSSPPNRSAKICASFGLAKQNTAKLMLPRRR